MCVRCVYGVCASGGTQQAVTRSWIVVVSHSWEQLSLEWQANPFNCFLLLSISIHFSQLFVPSYSNEIIRDSACPRFDRLTGRQVERGRWWWRRSRRDKHNNRSTSWKARKKTEIYILSSEIFKWWFKTLDTSVWCVLTTTISSPLSFFLNYFRMVNIADLGDPLQASSSLLRFWGKIFAACLVIESHLIPFSLLESVTLLLLLVVPSDCTEWVC